MEAQEDPIQKRKIQNRTAQKRYRHRKRTHDTAFLELLNSKILDTTRGRVDQAPTRDWKQYQRPAGPDTIYPPICDGAESVRLPWHMDAHYGQSIFNELNTDQLRDQDHSILSPTSDVSSLSYRDISSQQTNIHCDPYYSALEDISLCDSWPATTGQHPVSSANVLPTPKTPDTKCTEIRYTNQSTSIWSPKKPRASLPSHATQSDSVSSNTSRHQISLDTTASQTGSRFDSNLSSKVEDGEINRGCCVAHEAEKMISDVQKLCQFGVRFGLLAGEDKEINGCLSLLRAKFLDAAACSGKNDEDLETSFSDDE